LSFSLKIKSKHIDDDGDDDDEKEPTILWNQQVKKDPFLTINRTS